MYGPSEGHIRSKLANMRAGTHPVTERHVLSEVQGFYRLKKRLLAIRKAIRVLTVVFVAMIFSLWLIRMTEGSPYYEPQKGSLTATASLSHVLWPEYREVQEEVYRGNAPEALPMEGMWHLAEEFVDLSSTIPTRLEILSTKEGRYYLREIREGARAYPMVRTPEGYFRTTHPRIRSLDQRGGSLFVYMDDQWIVEYHPARYR